MKFRSNLKDSLLLAVTSQLKQEVKTPIITKCWFAEGNITNGLYCIKCLTVYKRTLCD